MRKQQQDEAKLLSTKGKKLSDTVKVQCKKEVWKGGTRSKTIPFLLMIQCLPKVNFVILATSFIDVPAGNIIWRDILNF